MGNSSSYVGKVLPDSSSRCLTEVVTAAHDFEVTNYPLLDGMGVGKFVSSGVFTVGGHDWVVKFFPDGSMKEEDKNMVDSASAYLQYLGKEKDVTTKYSLNFLAKQSKAQETYHDKIQRTFSLENNCWGYPRFIPKWKVQQLSGFGSGCFIIRCVLTVIKATRTEEERSLPVVPQPNLHLHLRHLLENGEGADVTFSVKGRSFDAHRCVLAARSPVFMADFFGSEKEKAMERVEVDGVEPPIFEALLYFMYTDSVPDDFKQCNIKKMQQLLVAADRYEVDRLKVMCESKLCEIIDMATVVKTLILAEQHKCTLLRDACIGFITSRDMLATIMGTDGFKQLVARSPLLIEKILQKVSRV